MQHLSHQSANVAPLQVLLLLLVHIQPSTNRWPLVANTQSAASMVCSVSALHHDASAGFAAGFAVGAFFFGAAFAAPPSPFAAAPPCLFCSSCALANSRRLRAASFAASCSSGRVLFSVSADAHVVQVFACCLTVCVWRLYLSLPTGCDADHAFGLCH